MEENILKPHTNIVFMIIEPEISAENNALIILLKEMKLLKYSK